MKILRVVFALLGLAALAVLAVLLYRQALFEKSGDVDRVILDTAALRIERSEGKLRIVDVEANREYYIRRVLKRRNAGESRYIRHTRKLVDSETLCVTDAGERILVTVKATGEAWLVKIP